MIINKLWPTISGCLYFFLCVSVTVTENFTKVWACCNCDSDIDYEFSS